MNIVAINISASIMILLTIFVRKPTKKWVPHSVFSLLWVLIGLRLLIPISVRTSISYLNPIIYAKNEWMHNLKVQNRETYEFVSGTMGTIQTISGRAKEELFYIWLAICCAIAVFFIVQYIRAWKDIQDSIPLQQDNLWLQSIIDEQKFFRKVSVRMKADLASPSVWGAINPTIFFPIEFDFQEKERIRFIILHECGHIKYFHFLWKLLNILLVCLYWYNPFVWLMFCYQERDLEITADRYALRHLDKKQRKAYADTLISAIERAQKRSAFYSHYKSGFVKERLDAIMNFKKMTVGAMVMTLLIPMGMTTAFATTNTILEENNTNLIVTSNISVDSFAVEEMNENLVEEADSISINVEWEDLAPYLSEGTARASYLYVQYYEYSVYGRIPPKTLDVTTTVDGHTYSGTLDRVDYIYQNFTNVYTGYYSGKIYRQ